MSRMISLVLILGLAACAKSGPDPKPDNGKPDEPAKTDPPPKTDEPDNAAVHESKVKSTRASMQLVADALVLFKFDHDRYPEKLEDMIVRPSYVKEGNWASGGYLQAASDLKDAWGNGLVYRVAGGEYELCSYGADGREGGEGRNLDLWASP